jgi:YfiH family protein
VSDGHIRVELPGATVLFTSRGGGVSTGPYASLNLGGQTDDDPAAVAENVRRVEAENGVTLVRGAQVHGPAVTRVTEPPAARVGGEADGQATALRGVAPLVITADCLPIAVAGTTAVAMLHGGWRGLAGGVIAEGVRALRDLEEDGPLAAVIGPGAGPCCYEVGEEVHAAFAQHGDAVRGPGRNLDLKAVARLELQAAGIADVQDLGICTICDDPERWFSHRRDHGVTGRQGGVVWLSS